MKLGFLAESLEPSQLAYYMVRAGNELSAERDVVAFVDHPSVPCLPPLFGVMHASEAWGYDGAVVATTLAGARRLLRFPSPSRRLFYVWDLEWLRGRHAYEDLRAVYADPRLSLLARGPSHARLISSCWGREAAVVDDFDPAALRLALA